MLFLLFYYQVRTMKKKIKKNSFIQKIVSLPKSIKVLSALFVVLVVIIAIVVPKIDGKNLE